MSGREGGGVDYGAVCWEEVRSFFFSGCVGRLGVWNQHTSIGPRNTIFIDVDVPLWI